MIAGGSGTNIKSLNQGILSAIVVPLPSLVEQERLARRLEDTRDATRDIELRYLRKIDALDELKQSLLHQAFSGQM